MKRDFIRYGLVGGGSGAFIGAVHKVANKFSDRTELVAGCFSRSPENNVESAHKFRVKRVYDSYEEMARAEAASEDGIDFVSIVTPNCSHYEIAKTFLEHGINVICEKPLCATVQQAEELVELTKEKGLLFGMTYTYTGYPIVKLARQMVQEGKIGDVLFIAGEYPQEWLLGTLDEDKGATQLSIWRTQPETSGISNCVGDIGSHIENVVSYVTGLKIKRVAAAVDYWGKELDLNANMIVEYESGARGNYWCSQVSAGHYNDLVFRIFGTKGSLEWHQENPECLKVCMKDEPIQLYYRGAECIYGTARETQRIPSGHVEGFFAAFANIYRNYSNAVLKMINGEELTEEDMDFPTAEDGLNGVKFIHAAIESGKKDAAWITL